MELLIHLSCVMAKLLLSKDESIPLVSLMEDWRMYLFDFDFEVIDHGMGRQSGCGMGGGGVIINPICRRFILLA